MTHATPPPFDQLWNAFQAYATDPHPVRQHNVLRQVPHLLDATVQHELARRIDQDGDEDQAALRAALARLAAIEEVGLDAFYLRWFEQAATGLISALHQLIAAETPESATEVLSRHPEVMTDESLWYLQMLLDTVPNDQSGRYLYALMMCTRCRGEIEKTPGQLESLLERAYVSQQPDLPPRLERLLGTSPRSYQENLPRLQEAETILRRLDPRYAPMTCASLQREIAQSYLSGGFGDPEDNRQRAERAMRSAMGVFAGTPYVK
ncbi:MAG: hypothetical protein ABI743_07065, partial [bacterium]